MLMDNIVGWTTIFIKTKKESAVADNYLCHHPNFYEENVKMNKILINAMPYILNSANLDYYDHTDTYKRLGYVPYNQSAVGTSITLENAYEDWVIYNLIDKGKIASGYEKMKETYRQRALNFKNVFHPETGFAQARYEDGNYSFYVPHDVNGLIKIMAGGELVFTMGSKPNKKWFTEKPYSLE